MFEGTHVKFCKQYGIGITAFAALGAPGFTEGKEFPPLMKNEVVLSLAKKYNKTPAQILIRWSLDVIFFIFLFCNNTKITTKRTMLALFLRAPKSKKSFHFILLKIFK